MRARAYVCMGETEYVPVCVCVCACASLILVFCVCVKESGCVCTRMCVCAVILPCHHIHCQDLRGEHGKGLEKDRVCVCAREKERMSMHA